MRNKLCFKYPKPCTGVKSINTVQLHVYSAHFFPVVFSYTTKQIVNAHKKKLVQSGQLFFLYRKLVQSGQETCRLHFKLYIL